MFYNLSSPGRRAIIKTIEQIIEAEFQIVYISKENDENHRNHNHVNHHVDNYSIQTILECTFSLAWQIKIISTTEQFSQLKTNNKT